MFSFPFFVTNTLIKREILRNIKNQINFYLCKTIQYEPSFINHVSIDQYDSPFIYKVRMQMAKMIHQSRETKISSLLRLY